MVTISFQVRALAIKGANFPLSLMVFSVRFFKVPEDISLIIDKTGVKVWVLIPLYVVPAGIAQS